MRLKDLADWSRIPEPQSIEGVLRGGKPSQLGHFVVLDIEYRGVDSLVLVRVSPELIERVLSVLKNHLGRSMREVRELEIDT